MSKEDIFAIGGGLWIAFACITSAELQLFLDKVSEIMETDEYQGYSSKPIESKKEKAKETIGNFFFLITCVMFWWILLPAKYLLEKVLSRP